MAHPNSSPSNALSNVLVIALGICAAPFVMCGVCGAVGTAGIASVAHEAAEAEAEAVIKQSLKTPAQRQAEKEAAAEAEATRRAPVTTTTVRKLLKAYKKNSVRASMNLNGVFVEVEGKVLTMTEASSAQAVALRGPGGQFGPTVVCHVDEYPSARADVARLDKGDKVTVIGRIEDPSGGSENIWLRECRIKN